MKNLGGITDPKDLVNKEYVDGIIGYGVCSTAAATAAKTVTIEGLKLVAGTIAVVKFTNANSVASPTLNVNGLGAKPIYRYGTTASSTGTTTTGWRAGAVQVFVYDGTGWVRDFWENTTYSNVSLGQGYGTCATAASTTAKVVTLSSYSLTTGGVVAVKFTYAVPAGATMNINSKGAKAIYHRGSAIKEGVIKAGDTATFIYNGTYYHLLCVDRDEDTDTVYTHPSYTQRTGVPASNQTPAFGDSFKVTQPTSDATGHITAMNERTVVIPDTLSNGTSTPGLIKTTSTVTSPSGYTPCPVVNGVPFYKDTISESEGVAYITETGTSGIWTYRKWSNGVAECWGTYTQAVNINGSTTFAGGTVYITTAKIITTFPSGLFIEAPKCTSDYHGAFNSSGTGYAAFPYVGDGKPTATATSGFNLMRIGSSATGLTAYVDYYAIGKWK